VSGKLALAFEDLGEVVLKNRAKPVRVYRLATGVYAPAGGAEPSGSARPSIAVLPFANMSGDPSQQYFCDGITEDILTELQRFRGLAVIARNSSFQYRNGTENIKGIGRALGARYVVEGSVRRAPDRIRITAQLIEAETAAHLWAERYDRNIADLFAIQDEISRSIATTLWSAIDVAEEERAKRKDARQMQAYDYILRARNIWFNWTQESNAEAQSLIRRAIELDPEYATGWAWLAWVHIDDWRRFRTDDRERTFDLALDAARRAIALDPHDYFSHWPMAYLLVYSRKYDEGLAEYEKTLALNPNDSRLLDEMSRTLCLLGRPTDAIVQSKLAMRLDPLHPEWFFGSLAFAHYVNREYEQAIAALANMVTTSSKLFLDIRAATCAQLGRLEEARAALANDSKSRPERWHYLNDIYPFKNPADFDHLLEGLRKAGLPANGSHRA
jgi:adenylate cyclase